MSIDVESFLENHFTSITPVPTKIGEVRVSPCPECGGRKRKLYVNIESRTFQCFKCGYSGRIGSGVQGKDLMLDMGANIHDYIIDDGLDSYLSRPHTPTEKEKIVTPIVKQLPAEYRPIIGNNSVQGNQALTYLRNRGMNDSLIAEYKLGFCFSGEYANRIIIPYYENGELLFYTGRDFTDSLDPKYLNVSWERKHFFFNYERVVSRNGYDFIVIVEGPFDVLSMPEHAVCLLGKAKELSEEQVKLLKKFKRIYIALDNDATKDSYALCMNIRKKFSAVYTVVLPEGSDPGILKEKMYDLLKEAKQYSTSPSVINTDHLKLVLARRR